MSKLTQYLSSPNNHLIQSRWKHKTNPSHYAISSINGQNAIIMAYIIKSCVYTVTASMRADAWIQPSVVMDVRRHQGDEER